MYTDFISYALVTPARNEEKYIESTIKSVISQTVTPVRWAIVSDGSTDRTDEIIGIYAKQYNWIKLIRLPEHTEHQFAAKVFAFNAGYEVVNEVSFEIIGNLDADLTFEPDYFAFLLSKFLDDPKLGVAGTPFVEKNFHSYKDTSQNIEHVSGACQLFRKQCFTQIGGYKPHKGGGIDWMAVTSARMMGWHTRTFPEKELKHHRQIGTGGAHPLKAAFKTGQKDYYQGSHPLWELFRTIFQFSKRPYIISGLLLACGYCWSWLMLKPRPVSTDLMAFYRSEQMARLRQMLLSRGRKAKLP